MPEAGTRLRIVAYSDYVCPWCYIGLHRIEQLQHEFPVDVEWRPFELHPETPKTGAHWLGRLGSEARAHAYKSNIITLARASDIPMEMPRIIANSHRALEAAEFARDHGGYDAMHHALFEAYFEHGRDIGDLDVLCDIAREHGVDDQGLRQALADDVYAERIDAVTNAAREDEILSTPTFVFTGGFRLTGAQDYNVFESITTRLLARIASGAIAAD
jgi:predicted DsbA family dithiol-disulfide isomerase